MKRYGELIDLSFIIVAALLYDFYHFELVSTLLAAFVAISVASLCLFDELPKLQAVLCLGLALSGVFWPQMQAFLGLVVYFAIQHEWRAWLLLALLPASIVMMQVATANSLGLLLLFLALSAWLSKHTRDNLWLSRALVLQKDNNRELHLQFQDQRDQWNTLRLSEAKAATLEERARIAREMHDSVGHVLTRAILQAGALSKLNHDEKLQAPLAALEETLGSGMTQTRESLHQLRDKAVDLYHEFDLLCHAYPSARYQIKLEYELTHSLPMNYQQAFLATTQEALTNVEKHSNASLVWVRLREFPGFYQLIVQDNGRSEGMGAVQGSGSPGEGMGLESMRLRCEALGGNFYVRREKGFGVFMTLPKSKTQEKTAWLNSKKDRQSDE